MLIFDEVMTGFRVALGGAQALYGIKPDLTTLGKIVGGGMPVGAFGGRRDIMERIAPLGPVYQAGTLSGNPVAMAAGLATLEGICEPGFHARLAEKTMQLIDGLNAGGARGRRCRSATNHVCGMFGLFFTDKAPVRYFREVMACDVRALQALLPRDARPKASISRRRRSKPDSSPRAQRRGHRRDDRGGAASVRRPEHSGARRARALHVPVRPARTRTDSRCA